MSENRAGFATARYDIFEGVKPLYGHNLICRTKKVKKEGPNKIVYSIVVLIQEKVLVTFLRGIT